MLDHTDAVATIAVRNTARRGDVHETGDGRAAWFKDPDGNILALVSR